MNIIFRLIFRFCATAIIILTYFQIAVASDDSNKYQDIFYPNGMPVKSYIRNGRNLSCQAVYNLCDELNIPNSNSKVVVFYERDCNKYYDNLHHLFISILQQNGNSWDIKYLNEITNYIQISAEPGPGYVDKLEGILEYFNVASYNAVHLNLFADLSGTGGISSNSDIFFIIKNNQLSPALELLNDVEGDRGPDYFRLNWTLIYFAGINADGNIDIITQEYDYKKDIKNDIYINTFSNSLNLYKFDNSNNKYKLDSQLSALPNNAIKVKRYFEPQIPFTDNCCP
jgi:hypothetical protein